jgi:hypothetical protein
MANGSDGTDSLTGSGSIPGMPEQPDIASLINMDEISEQLARFIREIDVTVYWDVDGDADEVSMTTHVIKPTGPAFVSPDAEQPAGTTGTSSAGKSAFGGMTR